MRYGPKCAVERLEGRVLLSATSSATAEVTRVFRNGLNGYDGADDTHVLADQPATAFGAATKAEVDGDTRGSVSGNQPAHALLRFRDVFGDGAGQVPVGANVVAATLALVTGSTTNDDSDSPTALHRMRQTWSESSTWNSLGNGISADGTEAASSADATVTPAALGGKVMVDVTAALRAWAADPGSSLGWALLPGGTDGWLWLTSEVSDASKRPTLSVRYTTASEQEVNQPPIVSAGSNLTVTMPNTAALNGSVTDDGLPEPSALTTSWVKVSGPGTVAFGDAGDVDTTASFSTAGTYVLRLTAGDGALSAHDDVTIVVNPASTSPLVRLDSMSLSTNTGEKPQSKVWEHRGAWWSVLPNSSGTWLWRLDGTKWTAVLKLSSTTGTKADVLEAGDVVHVLLYKGTSSTRLASVEYVPGSPGTYRMWSGRSSLATVPLSSGVETATVAVDGAGRMWVASDASTTIQVRYSDAPYGTWSSPITLASGTSSDDIAAIAALPDGSVGVLWSNQAAERFGFRRHAAGAAAGTWSANEVPASQSALNVGDGMADDHVSVAVASNGTLYAAVKTSYNTSGRPAIALLVRRPSGQWDNLYTVDSTGNTRPIVVLNEAAGSLRVFYTHNDDSGPGDIVYRQSPMSGISFGPRTTILSDVYNNPSSARHAANGSLVVIATDGSNRLAGVRMAWSSTSASSLFASASVGATAGVGSSSATSLASGDVRTSGAASPPRESLVSSVVTPSPDTARSGAHTGLPAEEHSWLAPLASLRAI